MATLLLVLLVMIPSSGSLAQRPRRPPARPALEKPTQPPPRPTTRAPNPQRPTVRTVEAQVKPLAPFSVAAGHDGQLATEYRLLQDNVVVQTLPRSALVNGVVTFPFAQGLSTGRYTLVVQAVAVATPDSACVKAGNTIQYCSSFANSEDVTLTVSTAVPNALTTDAAQYKGGAPVTVTWSSATPAATDWVGIFDVNINEQFGRADTKGTPTGSVQLPAATTPGWYYARYCRVDGFCPFVSPSFEVLAGEPPPPLPVDCVGSWGQWTPVPPGEWSACVDGTQTRMEQRTYTVTTPAANGGKDCEAVNGAVEKREAKQSCTPPPSGASAPVATACRWTLSAQPPDTSGGWRGRWRQNGATVGGQDNSPPYDRTFNVTTGVFKYDVEWSKSGGTTQMSAVLELTCR